MPDSRPDDLQVQALLRALLDLRNVDEAWRFLRDLLTDDEIAMITRRWQVVSMLSAGLSYRQIEESTGMSSRTVARVAHWFKQGPGGYRLILQRKTPAKRAAGPTRSGTRGARPTAGRSRQERTTP